MGDALMASTIANFDHFKDLNTLFAPWNTVIMLSGHVFIPYPLQNVDKGLLKYFLDIKVWFSWRGEAITVPPIANFDHFKGQNTHFVTWSTVFMLSGDVFIL